MSIQIAEISQRLQSALDQNYNVADMDTVLQVISMLENIQITKEQLETTRLGKYINHLRRKTANESLARRAKNLLKKWREMVLPSVGVAAQSQNIGAAASAVAAANTHQNVMPPIAKDSPALGMPYGVQQSYYNQIKEPAQFHDVTSSSSVDYTKYPSSDSKRYGRSHGTGSNQSAAEPMEDYSTRYSKFHDNKSNLSANTGVRSSCAAGASATGATVAASFSGKSSKDSDPYRTLSTINENSKSHISISALPKIPKIKNSAASQRLSKHSERSHSPLVNLKENPSQKFTAASSLGHDDNSTHSYDMQNYKRFPPNQTSSSILNGRIQNYGEYNPTAMDNNSNSSSINIITEMNVPNVSQPVSESVNNEVVKKKHKKHKKDKKSKKQKHSTPPSADRIPIAGPPILELPDSLSSNSMSLFANTTDSIKDQQQQNMLAMSNSIATSLPSTSLNASTAAAAVAAAASVPPPRNALWPSTLKTSPGITDDLTFSGKFTKTDDNIINIDSSSGSNSPKYRSHSPKLPATASRSSSPSRLNMLPMRTGDYGSRVATDEENSFNQHISLLNQTDSPLASPFGDALMQDNLIANDPAKGLQAQTNVASGSHEVQQTGKKRGRKKGSKGVDSRLGSASNSSHSQQAGAPYYDSISFSSLKNKIDLIRGTTKKVKTTKELLAELQNRKATTSADDVSVIESELQSELPDHDSDESAVANGKYSRVTTPSSYAVLDTVPRSERSSKKSKSAPKDESISDNQSLCGNQAIADIPEPKSMIDLEISELCAKLPPIDRTAISAWNNANKRDAIICTCKLIEVTDSQLPTDSSTIKTETNSMNISVPKMSIDCNVLPPTTADSQAHQSLFGNVIDVDINNVDDNDRSSHSTTKQSTTQSTGATSEAINTAAAAAKFMHVKSTNEPSKTIDVPTKKPPVKSIFDLDYDDDDDDPITFKLNHNNNINLNTKLNKLSRSRDSNKDNSDDKSCDDLFLNESIKRVDGQRFGAGNDNDKDAGATATSKTLNRCTPFDDSAATNKKRVDDDNVKDEDDVDDDDCERKSDRDEIQTIVIDSNTGDSVHIVLPQTQNDESATTAATAAAAAATTAAAAPNATVDLNAMALQSRFRIEEDPECKAKYHYITSKQLITEYHIEQLHTAYIPNINGNWDDDANDGGSGVGFGGDIDMDMDKKPAIENISNAPVIDEVSPMIVVPVQPADAVDVKTEVKDEPIDELEHEPRITEATIGLYERVVPLCNHINMDRLPKNLSHINLDFGPSDEVEPHIFIASISGKHEVNDSDRDVTSSPKPVSMGADQCKSATENNDQSNVDSNNSELLGDELFAARINDDFHIYDCDNDVDDIEFERKRSPEIDFPNECEAIQADLECEPTEPPLEMEVDDIAIKTDAPKTDNNLCPIAADPFVVPAAAKPFSEESDDGDSHSEAAPPSPVVDDNARTDVDDDDDEPVHQVIDLNPSQILPAADENAMDSMDFENQFSKSFDMGMPNEREEFKHVRARSEGSRSDEAIDVEVEPVETIPIIDSDDENVDDENSIFGSEDDLAYNHYGQDDTSNDHFITLDNFDAVSSSKRSNSSGSSGSSSSVGVKESKLIGSMVCDDDDDDDDDDDEDDDDDDGYDDYPVEHVISSIGERVDHVNDGRTDDNDRGNTGTASKNVANVNHIANVIHDDIADDNDDDSDIIDNYVEPTTVLIEGDKANLFNDNSDSYSEMNWGGNMSEAKPLDTESSDSDESDNDFIEIKDQVSTEVETAQNADNSKPIVQKLTKDALETHQALSSQNTLSNQLKRFRSPSLSSSTSSTSTSGTAPEISSAAHSPRTKKSKRWPNRTSPTKPYRVPTSSHSPIHSPMSALSSSSLFVESNAINEPSSAPATCIDRMDLTDSLSIPSKDFFPVPDLNEHVDSGLENGQLQKPTRNVGEIVDTEQQLSADISPDAPIEGQDILMDSNTSPLLDFVHDELIDTNASLGGIFEELPLPEQLLQSDEKDSNSLDSMHQSGLSRSLELMKAAEAVEAAESNLPDQIKDEKCGEFLSSENNGVLPSFNNLSVENMSGVTMNGYKFKEWYEVVHVKSYNDELLTILPYVVID